MMAKARRRCEHSEAIQRAPGEQINLARMIGIERQATCNCGALWAFTCARPSNLRAFFRSRIWRSARPIALIGVSSDRIIVTPADAVTESVWSEIGTRKEATASSRAVAFIEALDSLACQRTATSSSPPQRATTSVDRTLEMRRLDTACKTRSPATCPYQSFTPLKLSISKTTTAACV